MSDPYVVLDNYGLFCVGHNVQRGSIEVMEIASAEKIVLENLMRDYKEVEKKHLAQEAEFAADPNRQLGEDEVDYEIVCKNLLSMSLFRITTNGKSVVFTRVFDFIDKVEREVLDGNS